MATVMGTAMMGMTTTMTTEAICSPTSLSASTLMQLMWMASPALPVGGFSYSEGMESAVESGRVHDEASAGHWLGDQLHLSLARNDAAVTAQAYSAWRQGHEQRVIELNAWVVSSKETSEQRLQAEQMGRSLLQWLRNGPHQHDERVRQCEALAPAPTWPVAFALAAVLSGATQEAALLCLAFAWADNQVQAAVKAVPLGQAAAQRVLQGLTQAIPEAMRSAAALDDDSRQAFTPMLAILCAQHETQYSRLFRS